MSTPRHKHTPEAPLAQSTKLDVLLRTWRPPEGPADALARVDRHLAPRGRQPLGLSIHLHGPREGECRLPLMPELLDWPPPTR